MNQHQRPTPPMNPYHVLGVAKESNQDEIKKAYRSLAQKFHPDNQETGDENQFLLVKKAYDVLGNTVMRKHYDDTGLTEMLPPVEQRADDALAGLINEVVTRQLSGNDIDLTIDIIGECRNRLLADIHQLSITDQGLTHAIQLTEMLKDRIKTSDENNVFEKVLDEKIRRMHCQLNMNKDTHELFNAIEKRLDTYSDTAIKLN